MHKNVCMNTQNKFNAHSVETSWFILQEEWFLIILKSLIVNILEKMIIEG